MSDVFDREYYETIWQDEGVHRHSICESMANYLIAKHGQVSILEIGGGCNYVVKILREKGCDAWGLELSEYAVRNSCSPDHTIRGDIRNIPFADGRFDVVHTSGVFGYTKDVEQSWVECKRVGGVQDHNIDYNDRIPEHRYVITESEQWWNERLS